MKPWERSPVTNSRLTYSGTNLDSLKVNTEKYEKFLEELRATKR